MNVTLFVGFGGSGGKCLARMARTMADDHELSDLARRTHFFLLVDTDRGELDSAKSDIEREFSRLNGMRPVVETIDLAANVDMAFRLVEGTIGNHVAQSKEAGADTQGLRSLLDHWHFKKIDSGYEAFDARRMPRPLHDGAGQIPAVGHLAMWHKLPELERKLQSLSEAMRNRGNEGPSVDMMMVGSLAGGTGRGCWQLLALRSKEFFEAQGMSMQPVAFFLDSSCFLTRVDPRMHWRLHVNTLTGVSEIVAHLRNLKTDTMVVKVPHLHDPTSTQPVVDTSRWPEALRAPINTAFLFSANSDAAALSKEDIEGQVGRAIYACSGIPSLVSSLSQELPAGDFGAMGVGSASVPISDIYEFLKLHARSAAIDQLLAIDPVKCAEAKSRVDSLLRGVAFKCHPDPTSVGWEDDADGLIARCKNQYLDQLDLQPVREALEENQGVEAVFDAARIILRGDVALASRVADELLELNEAREVVFVSALERLIHECLRSGDSPLSQAEAFAAECKARVDALCDAAVQARDHRVTLREDEFREFLKERAGRSVPVFGKRWSESEINEIEARLRSMSWKAALRSVFRKVGERLDRLDRRVEQSVAAIAAAKSALAASRDRLSEDAQDKRRQCFLPDDNTGNHGLAALIVDWDRSAHKLDRTLRPWMGRSKASALAASACRNSSFTTAASVLREKIFELVQGFLAEKVSLPNAKRQLDKPIQEMVDRVDVAAEDLKREFKILPVLESMECRYRRYLNEIRGDHPATERAQAYLESFFGRRFVKDEDSGEYKEIEAIELFHSLCYSLAQVTDPMLHVPAEANAGGLIPDRVKVLVPQQLGGSADEATVQGALDFAGEGGRKEMEDGQRIRRRLKEVPEYSMKAEAALHFAIFTFTQRAIPVGDAQLRDPFRGFASLSEWSTNPRVRTWLRRCEGDRFAADGSYWVSEDSNFGIGYVMPWMMSPQWSRLRWTPWIEGDEVGQHRRRILDAVLYAMTGNMDGLMLASAEDYLVDARKVLAMCAAVKPGDGRDDAWTMPLLRRQDDGSWRFTRRSFVRERGLVVAGGTAWQEGRSFSTIRDMIRQLGLRPNELTEDGQKFLLAIEAERHLLQSELLPKLEDAGERRREKLNQALGTFLENYESNYLSKRHEEQRGVEAPILEELRALITQGARAFRWDAPVNPS